MRIIYCDNEKYKSYLAHEDKIDLATKLLNEELVQTVDSFNALSSSMLRVEQLLFLNAEFELGAFHTSKVKLWENSYDAQGNETLRYDLTLSCDIEGISVKVIMHSSMLRKDGGFEELQEALHDPIGVVTVVQSIEIPIVLEAILIVQAL